MEHLLQDLTPAQRDAVRHVEGPLLILAGPGSGKTRVVTHRIAHLLAHGVSSHEILALTFTNKAADEMASRVEQLAPGQPVWVSTFHPVLCPNAAEICPTGGNSGKLHNLRHRRQPTARCAACYDALKIDTTHYTPDAINAGISWAKNRLIRPSDYQPRPGHALGSVVKKVYPAYQKLLATCNAVDFDDLLLHVATILRENPEVRGQLDQRYRFVLVDEYQDTNLAQ